MLPQCYHLNVISMLRFVATNVIISMLSQCYLNVIISILPQCYHFNVIT